MSLTLQRALRFVAGSLATCAILFVAIPFIDVALHIYDGPVAFVVGVLAGLLSAVLFFASRSNAAKTPSKHRLVASLLWVAVLLLGAASWRLLYLGVRRYGSAA